MALTLNKDDRSQDFMLHWVLLMPDKEADQAMTDMVFHEVRTKLAKKRDEGRGGWFGPNCSNDRLMSMLKEHLEKGDMIDVINFAAMIHARTKLFGESAKISI